MDRNHYVSRFMTKDWELGRNDRRLWGYDFAQNQFFCEPSSSLFAREGSKENNALLSQLVEGPLARKRKQVLDRREPGAVQLDEQTHQALLVWMPTQIARIAGVEDHNPDFLHQHLRLLQQHPGHMAWAQWQKYTSIGILLPTNANSLCYPSIGFFHFPIIKGECGWGVPFSRRLVFVVVPRRINVNLLLRVDFALFSVGMKYSRIVLDPWLKEAYAEDDMRKIVLSSRQRCTEQTDLMGPFRL